MPAERGQHPWQVLDSAIAQPKPELVVHAVFERLVQIADPFKDAPAQEDSWLRQVITLAQQSLKVICTGLLRPEWSAEIVDHEAVAKDHVHGFVRRELPSDQLEGTASIAIVGVQPRQDLAAAASEAAINRFGLVRAPKDNSRYTRCCFCE